MDADSIISKLKMRKHPEGGYYHEFYRSREKIPFSMDQEEHRNLSTSVYFLLKSGETSAFHQLMSDEIWYFHKGSPLRVYCITNDNVLETYIFGNDISRDESPQILFPAGTIFGAEVIEKNSYCLFGCMVSPGFDFNDFKLFSFNELKKN